DQRGPRRVRRQAGARELERARVAVEAEQGRGRERLEQRRRVSASADRPVEQPPRPGPRELLEDRVAQHRQVGRARLRPVLRILVALVALVALVVLGGVHADPLLAPGAWSATTDRIAREE